MVREVLANQPYERDQSPTPMIYDEYLRCKSEYHLSNKEDSSEISSDGEFKDANKIITVDEDDSYVD